MIPAVKIQMEKFKQILGDKEWSQFLVLKDDGSTWIDLKNYSDGRVYLPIGKSYVDGFLLTKDLYDHKYRTEHDLVRIEALL